jgi:hypothetical protein
VASTLRSSKKDHIGFADHLHTKHKRKISQVEIRYGDLEAVLLTSLSPTNMTVSHRRDFFGLRLIRMELLLWLDVRRVVAYPQRIPNGLVRPD